MVQLTKHVQLTKQCFAYVIDRLTGAPIWPIEERPVPVRDVPEERTARPRGPSPRSRRPSSDRVFARDYLIDFTPELRKEALEIVKS